MILDSKNSFVFKRPTLDFFIIKKLTKKIRMKIRFNFEIKKVRDLNNIEDVRALCKVAFGTLDK